MKRLVGYGMCNDVGRMVSLDESVRWKINTTGANLVRCDTGKARLVLQSVRTMLVGVRQHGVLGAHQQQRQQQTRSWTDPDHGAKGNSIGTNC